MVIVGDYAMENYAYLPEENYYTGNNPRFLFNSDILPILKKYNLSCTEINKIIETIFDIYLMGSQDGVAEYEYEKSEKDE